MKPGLPDIRHRLQSMHYLELIINWQKESSYQSADILISVDENPFIKTNEKFIIGPIRDVGIISMRILLEFMGLKVDRKSGALKNRLKRRNETDDIFIEDFHDSRGNALPLVEVEDIRKVFPNHFEKVVKALERTISHAHKGTAHLTNYRVTDPDVFDMYLYAAKAIRRLMTSYFYSRIVMCPEKSGHVILFKRGS